jgi:hypothetical protein
MFRVVVLSKQRIAHEELRINFDFPLDSFPVVLHLLLTRHFEVFVGWNDLGVLSHYFSQSLVQLVDAWDAQHVLNLLLIEIAPISLFLEIWVNELTFDRAT